LSRFQQGSIRKEERKKGAVWTFRYRAVRDTDGKRVERSLTIGPARQFSSKSAVWAEIDRRRIRERVNQPGFIGTVTFAELAAHYIEHELSDQNLAIEPRSHTTVSSYLRVLRLRVIPRWGKRPATSIKPLEVELWLKALKAKDGLANPTLAKTRNVMSLVFRHGIRHSLITGGEGSNPLQYVRCRTTSEYESQTIAPQQAFAIWRLLPEPERLLLLLAASTGVRVSEALGLQWGDIDYSRNCIHIRRAWSGGKVGATKTKASRATVPMHEVLAEHMRLWQRETPYSGLANWIFASFKLKGKQPRVANMIVEDYLRPAAVKAGVLQREDKRRFGFHTLRHSLATFLVATNTDAKTVQAILRHSDVATTLQLYVHSNSDAKLAAQGIVLKEFFATAEKAS
jgi:integrase